MKIVDCEQGTNEWKLARLGKPTSSMFHKILTPGGKISAQSTGYMRKLVAETLLGYPLDNLDGIPAVERGKELEPAAIRFYEFENDVELKKVGFITTDDGEIGCSPDRLAGETGLVQFKCPMPDTHIGYLVDGFDKDYMPQFQGEMWVAEKEWDEFYSYHPDMFPVKIRINRDDQYISILKVAVRQFVEQKNELLEKIKREGFFEKMEEFRAAKDPHDYGALDAG